MNPKPDYPSKDRARKEESELHNDAPQYPPSSVHPNDHSDDEHDEHDAEKKHVYPRSSSVGGK
jgi:hypothetical protein